MLRRLPRERYAFRARRSPVDIVITGELVPGTRVRLAPVELEILTVAESRTDDELVSASLRGAFEDLARGAALASVTAKTASIGAGAVGRQTEAVSADAAREVVEKSNAASNVAARVAQAAALASVLGSLSASSEERAEVSFRATIGDRAYRATCTSSDRRTMFDKDGRPSLSCAIVPVVEKPLRHWALSVRTPGGALEAKRLNGFVEARTAKGRDDAMPIVRIVSSDTAVSVRTPQGTETTKMSFNAFVELDTVAARVASVQLPGDNAPGRAWLDTSSLTDPEAREIVGVAAAILSAFRWPGLRSQER